MLVRIKPSALRETRWTEYLVRFAFGGAVTAAAGLVAHGLGPAAGGLLLAFPAIFPCGATLVERHERRKKERRGQEGRRRGRLAAALEAAGAALGAVGLLAFGTCVWILSGRLPAALVLAIASGAWLAISTLLWRISRIRRPGR